MWGFDEEQLTNLSKDEVYGENYFGNNWDDRMKLLAFEQQQLTMPTFGQIRALESTELTFGQLLAIENEFSNETFGQTLAFERHRESTELTFGQLRAIERNLELQEEHMTFGQTLALERNQESSELTFGQLLTSERSSNSNELTFGQIRALDKELSNKTFGQICAEASELTFSQLLASKRNRELQQLQQVANDRQSSEMTFGQLLEIERKLELQKKQVEQVATDRAAEVIQLDIVSYSMEIEQSKPLQDEFELHPLDHVEAQEDSSISHAGADEMLDFQTTHAGADEVCEWVILNSKEVVKEEMTADVESTETPHPELKLCQIFDKEARQSFQDHQLPPPRPVHIMMVKKKFHDYGLVVLNSYFQSVTGILLLRRKDPGGLVIPRVKTH